jgi:hypothetical protein
MADLYLASSKEMVRLGYSQVPRGFRRGCSLDKDIDDATLE